MGQELHAGAWRRPRVPRRGAHHSLHHLALRHRHGLDRPLRPLRRVEVRPQGHGRLRGQRLLRHIRRARLVRPHRRAVQPEHQARQSLHVVELPARERGRGRRHPARRGRGVPQRLVVLRPHLRRRGLPRGRARLLQGGPHRPVRLHILARRGRERAGLHAHI